LATKVGFLTGHELHYGQDFFVGELQARMKKNDMVAHVATLYARGVFGGQVSWAILNPQEINLIFT
jgi:hypothetical protein